MKQILICGTGPTAVQYAVLFDKLPHSAKVSMVGRAHTSQRSKAFYDDVVAHDLTVEVEVQNAKHRALEGSKQLDNIYADYKDVDGQFDTIVLAVTADAYLETLKQLPNQVLTSAKTIVLVSPTLGSHAIVKGYLSSDDIEVISFSTYLGDTRVLADVPRYRVCSTGMKKCLYIGSTAQQSENVTVLKALFDRLGIEMKPTYSALEAESRNISLYVHPPLFMNQLSLDTIFNLEQRPFYVYKLFPEGPITMTLIHEMRLLWNELSAVIGTFDVEGINLLQFMVKENYPLRDETMSDDDIDQFVSLPEIHQEYLLYVRYSAILIDPFSEPNAQGQYFDFSAVPFKTVYKNLEHRYDIPRMPKEDYYRTKMIQGIADMKNIDTPMIDTFIKRYEDAMVAFSNQQLPESERNSNFEVKTFEGDLNMVAQYI